MYLSINGTIIEQAIEGFQSVRVKGRDMPQADVSVASIGTRDGDAYVSRRYAGRTITISFALVASTTTGLLEIFDVLNALLDAEQAEIISAMILSIIISAQGRA